MFLMHEQYARAVAAERLQRAADRRLRPPRPQPPPARRRAAFAVGRLAAMLDREAARRAVTSPGGRN